MEELKLPLIADDKFTKREKLTESIVKLLTQTSESFLETGSNFKFKVFLYIKKITR